MLYYFQKAMSAFRREEGQALVEYALILSLVSIFSIAALAALGVDVSDVLNAVETAIDGVDD